MLLAGDNQAPLRRPLQEYAGRGLHPRRQTDSRTGLCRLSVIALPQRTWPIHAQPSRTAARRALSSKLAVTDGYVAVEIANDRSASIPTMSGLVCWVSVCSPRGATFQRRDAWRAIRWHTQRGRTVRFR